MTDATSADTGQRPDSRFSLKAFAQGMFGVVLIYAAIGGWVELEAEKTREAQMGRLPSKTVLVEWPEISAAAPVSAEDQHPGEAPDIPADMTNPETGLVEAPVVGLFEDTPLGKTPVIRKDGLTAFKAYRRPFDRAASGNKPLVTIVVAGLGLSDQATESALREMPPEVTFAFSPYTASPDFWIKEARARGHETWLTMPMETSDYPQTDPGPHTMLIGAPERDNAAKLLWLLSRTSGYTGFITDRNASFMNSVHDMRPVVGAIYSRGLGFADNAEIASAVPATMAHGMSAPYTAIDVWIDEPATQENIRAALEQLEKKAKERGAATGLIRPLPVSYQEVRHWLDTLDEKGFALAPLSAQTGL